MKASFYALLALLAMSLSACTTINPVHPSATVYPASQSVLVQGTPVAEVPAVQDTAPAPRSVDQSGVTALNGPYTCINADGSKVEVTDQAEIATAILSATCPQASSPIAQQVEVSESDLNCMALAIYHESRGEPDRGKAAVGYVILNRVNHPKYPKTVCGVVRDSNPRGCQFSWFCDGKSDKPRDMDSYARAREIALGVFNKTIPNPVGRAIYFDGYVHGSKHKPGQIQIANQRFYADYSARSPRPHSRR